MHYRVPRTRQSWHMMRRKPNSTPINFRQRLSRRDGFTSWASSLRPFEAFLFYLGSAIFLLNAALTPLRLFPALLTLLCTYVRKFALLLRGMLRPCLLFGEFSTLHGWGGLLPAADRFDPAMR